MCPEYTSPWIRLDPDNWDELISGRFPVLFKKNTMIYHEGERSETVYIVQTGRICITSYQPNGSEKQLYIAEQGAMFGETSCIAEQCHSVSAVAIVDSQVFCIPWTEITAAMRTSWSLNEKVMQMICRKKAVMQKQVVELSFADSLQRIAQMLLNISSAYGEEDAADGLRVSIRFTHQDVANLTNTSRVTVSNVFQMLTGKGILQKREGRFSLYQLDLLRQMANGVYSES